MGSDSSDIDISPTSNNKPKIKNNNEIADIEDLGIRKRNHKATVKEPVINDKNLDFTKLLYHLILYDKLSFKDAYRECRREYRCCPSKLDMHHCYKELITDGTLEKSIEFEFHIIKKLVRSASGIVVLTIFTAPGKMISPKDDASCPKDCAYCPSFPNQPKSYDPAEPASQRAEQNDFCPILQMFCRLTALRKLGHNIEKVQLEISGGTYCYYPREYIDEFMLKCYYAANIFTSDNNIYELWQNKENHSQFRKCKSLDEEQILNESSDIKLIGITIETRPDSINKREIRRLREYGVTRVQLGVQHTDNEILKLINREDTIESAYDAIEFLKVNCFKVDIHIMPDLPGSSPEKDLDMLYKFLYDQRLQADFWKIYPCQVLPYTKIKQWYEEGKYKPYAEENPNILCDILIEIKSEMKPWIRLNRIVRDFPGTSVIGGLNQTNLRQIIQDKMKRLDLECRCIRCREVGYHKVNRNENIRYHIENYLGSNGTEYFITCNSLDMKTLFGFLRLRFNSPNQKPVFSVLNNAGLIRELHVLGVMTNTGNRVKDKHQHLGIGWELIKIAQRITFEDLKLNKIVVIAGVGTRNYYRKKGFEFVSGKHKGKYMLKKLNKNNYYGYENDDTWLLVFSGILICILFIIQYFN